MNNLPIQGKNILLIAPPFYSLHLQLIKGLEDLGANVGYIPDKVRKFNPLFGTTSLKGFKQLYYRLFNPNRKYLKQYKDILRRKWDYLLCVDGYTFDKTICDVIKEINPNIKMVLYLWDSINFFDFKNNFLFFDKIYTFDPIDSKNFGIEYMPLYWIDVPPKKNDMKYDLAFVGTMHTDRYRLLKTIVDQCKKNNWTYNFKLVVNGKKTGWLDKIRYVVYKHINSPSAIGFVDEYRLKRGWEKSDFVVFNNLSSEEVQDCINSAKCIIDIANPLQTGITNRAIASLASGKKVLTTVRLVDNIISKNPHIQFIDRNYPIINCDLESEKNTQERKNEISEASLLNLRIDKWLKSILAF